MIRDILTAIVVQCWRQQWIVIGVSITLTIWAAVFAATHLDMDADEAIKIKRKKEKKAQKIKKTQGKKVLNKKLIEAYNR